jgi:hypothetical protein
MDNIQSTSNHLEESGKETQSHCTYFFFCGEGLSRLLKFSGPIYLSRGIRVGVHAPWVSHLLFDDDCLIFTQDSSVGAERLNELLELYRRGSGNL